MNFDKLNTVLVHIRTYALISIVGLAIGAGTANLKIENAYCVDNEVTPSNTAVSGTASVVSFKLAASTSTYVSLITSTDNVASASQADARKEATEIKKQSVTSVTSAPIVVNIPDGDVALTSSLGRIEGPSGEETYYNRNMSYCVSRMHAYGYEGEYWIRDDGVKMFGDYVMVAADFAIRPIGTILETSLGTGIVADTGEFIYANPTQLDIAVTW